MPNVGCLRFSTRTGQAAIGPDCAVARAMGKMGTWRRMTHMGGMPPMVPNESRESDDQFGSHS